MKVSKLEFKCECGAVIVVGDDDMGQLRNGKIVILRCAWCGEIFTTSLVEERRGRRFDVR